MRKTKVLSLNAKITLAFITIGFILLFILFVQIIPRLIIEQKEQKIHQMEHMIILTQNQLKFARELLINERKESISRIEKWFHKQSAQSVVLLNQGIDTPNVLETLSRKTSCNSYVLDKNKTTLYEESNSSLSIEKKLLLEKKTLHFFTSNQLHMCPKKTHSLLFQTFLDNGNRLILECQPEYFKSDHDSLEARIKSDLQKSFKLTYSDHKGKINLLWINMKNPNFSTQPLYESSDETYNKKYCMSKMSSSTFPQTGTLTAKQIVDAANKSPIKHQLAVDNSEPKSAMTWVRVLNNTGERQFFFLVTVFEEDLNKNLYEPLLKIMPAGVLALITAILLGFLIFRRMFNSIGILTNTVKEVNAGNRSIRSHLKGDDDIAFLAQSFDAMMDSIEKNIMQLDSKVENKTKQLQESLKEKETLLKEIHHRVKNNLAMTINLIKLQKAKLRDEKSQEVLTDIQERIFTMELLHKKLYESKDLNSISMKRYISELVDDLHATYQIDKTIQRELDIDDIFLDIEQALPCGLVITETLINSYKYAFKGAYGKVKISCKQVDGKIELIIQDDGVGLPEDFDIHTTKSLGLRLITSIVKGQLLGNIACDTTEGTKYMIQFTM